MDAIVVDYARHPSQEVPRHLMTSAAHREATAANSDQAATATLSSLNAVFTLSLILTQAASPRQAIRLLTTAVPSITSCHNVLAWHPSRSGDYYERAPRGVSSTLASDHCARPA